MSIKTFQSVEEEFEFLVSQIKFHNKKYYIDNSPEISDSEFDILNKKLYEILDKNPKLKENFNDLELLGSKLNLPDEKKRPHLKQMSSLQNIFTFKDLIDFDKKIHRFLGFEFKSELEINNLKSLKSKFEYCIEQKFDGVSFSALFIDGEFKLGLTRGDGFIGEDITSNLKVLPNWPLKLCKINENFKYPKKIEIRGEVFMPIKKFKELNEKFNQNEQKQFVNPRNAASGSLRILDSNEIIQRGLKYFVYSIGYVEWNENHSPQTQEELILLLKKFGFQACEFLRKSNDLVEIYNIYLDVLKSRNSLEYEIDGLVIKVNNLEFQEKLGQTGKYPRSAAAFKFPSNEAISRLLNISFSVGRTGAITPVGHISPIKIGGALISNVSLHNFDEIERLDLMINDIIFVKRSGDVIPQIISVFKEKRNLNEENLNFQRIKIEKLQNCPSCLSKLVKEENEVILRCENYFCKSRIIEFIKYFCSRDALNIIGLGDKQINYFFDNKFITGPIDIFFLEEKFSNEIRNLPNWGDKSASNLFENIKKAKNISFEKFLYSLGIRFIGQNNSKLIAKFFKKIDNFLDFVKKFDVESNLIINNEKLKLEILDQINQINGLGEKATLSLIKFLTNDKMRLFVKNLSNVLKIKDFSENSIEIDKKSNNIFFEKNIVLTGNLKSMTRQVAKEILSKQFNANLQSSLTKKTNFLIFGENFGSKFQKAKEIENITLINEEKFLEILKNFDINF